MGALLLRLRVVDALAGLLRGAAGFLVVLEVVRGLVPFLAADFGLGLGLAAVVFFALLLVVLRDGLDDVPAMGILFSGVCLRPCDLARETAGVARTH